MQLCLCVFRLEKISVQPPTSCSGGGAGSELFILHGGQQLLGLPQEQALLHLFILYIRQELTTAGAALNGGVSLNKSSS